MSGILSTPRPPKIDIPKTPTQEEIQAELDKKNKLRDESLARYLSQNNRLGLFQLRGSSVNNGTGYSQ